MKRILFTILTLAAFNANACFLEGQQQSGMNKICYYQCVSGMKAITIGAVGLCPLSI